MKRLPARTKRASSGTPGSDDPGMFSALHEETPEPARPLCSWRDHAPRIDARPFDPVQGARMFAHLWGAERHVVELGADDVQRMSEYLAFVQVPQGRDVIAQDELGDYMVLVLEGKLSVDRGQPSGIKVRLAEAHAGDMLGEMSLLDAGTRYSCCTTLTPCILAIVEAQRLRDMLQREPRLGAALLASLSRRLSLRLRQVSTRLSALLSQN